MRHLPTGFVGIAPDEAVAGWQYDGGGMNPKTDYIIHRANNLRRRAQKAEGKLKKIDELLDMMSRISVVDDRVKMSVIGQEVCKIMDRTDV